ncbi:MAG: hydrogenase maturation protease [Limisphaerales bacterium]
MTPRILIAGIGNIFFGDDRFGCEVAQQLARKPLPEQVRVIDFGIRSFDLAYELTDGFDTVILVDAMVRGEAPGTVAVIEPDLNRLNEFQNIAPDAHSLNPVSVLQLARSLGSLPDKLLLVACEPAVLESEEMELSEPVLASIPRAIEEIESILTNLLSANREPYVCLAAG